MILPYHFHCRVTFFLGGRCQTIGLKNTALLAANYYWLYERKIVQPCMQSQIKLDGGKSRNKSVWLIIACDVMENVSIFPAMTSKLCPITSSFNTVLHCL